MGPPLRCLSIRSPRLRKAHASSKWSPSGRKACRAFSQAPIVSHSRSPLSGGRLQVKVFPAGQLVGAMESFGAVSSGLADLYYASEITGILFTASTSFANPAVPSSSKIVKTSPKVATGPASPSCQLPVINLHKGFQGFSAFVGSGQYPRNPCNDISCWSQNRRAVTVLDSSS